MRIWSTKQHQFRDLVNLRSAPIIYAESKSLETCFNISTSSIWAVPYMHTALIPFGCISWKGSASAFLTNLSTFSIINTNLPFNAIYMACLRMFHVLRSFSTSCKLHQVMFPPPVDSKARLICSVYCFAKDGRSHEAWIVELSSVFACFKSVPFSGELLANEKSRSICRWGSVSSTRIGLNGTKTAPCHLLRIFQFKNSFLLKLIVRFTHLMVGIRLTSNQRLQSITKAMARLSDTKTPTSSCWSTWDRCSGRISKFSSFRIQDARIS